ncbi:MAG: hypothetical protein BKP49_03315 [Treponema sp. CETP13]|nr:MAG: hypothetical protein BKP49_03315 [Treponema sp. CETP13]
MNFSFLTNINMPQKFKKLMAEKLVSCQHCQPRDAKTKKKSTWVYGSPIQFSDFISELGIPKEFHDSIYNEACCPNCGRRLDEFTMVGEKSKSEMRMEKLIQERIYSINNTIYPELNKFCQYLERYPFLGAYHKTGQQIITDLQKIKTITIKDEIWFRGREPEGVKMFYLKDLLPPPPDEVRINERRYNHAGQSHFYLSSTKNTCFKEINCDSFFCWIEQFHIIKLPNIIDLRVVNSDKDKVNYPLLAAGIMHEELLNIPIDRKREGNWNPEYLLSRYIADSCQVNGINGILYSSTKDYDDNLVIFDYSAEACEYEPIGKPFRFEYGEN